MRIYVWTKDEINLVQELNILNSLLVKHRAEGYRVFKVCIDHLLLPEKAFIFFCVKRKKKMNTEWDIFIKTQRSVDKNGSMTWRVYPNKLSILYYFNDENFDLEKILK